MPRGACVGVLGEGAEDEALAGLKLEEDCALAHGRAAAGCGERVEDRGCARAGAEGDPFSDGAVGAVHEIIEKAVWHLAADEAEAVVAHGLAADIGVGKGVQISGKDEGSCADGRARAGSVGGEGFRGEVLCRESAECFAALGEIEVAGHVLREFALHEDGGSGVGEGEELAEGGGLHLLHWREQDGAVGVVSSGDDLAVSDVGFCELCI